MCYQNSRNRGREFPPPGPGIDQQRGTRDPERATLNAEPGTRNVEPGTLNADRHRLLVLFYEWPPVGGGGGRAARDVAETLARRGHQVRIQTVRLFGMPRREIHPNLQLYRTWGFRGRPD